jgi:hypothetical protein
MNKAEQVFHKPANLLIFLILHLILASESSTGPSLLAILVLATKRSSTSSVSLGSTREVEDYEVSLDSVAVLELAITPDLTRREAPATLAKWRVA